MLKFIWAKITGRPLVKLIDFDGEESISVAYTQDGYLFAERWWPFPLHTVCLKKDGTVRINPVGTVHGITYVKYWEYV